MGTDKPDPKKNTEPNVKTTKLPDEQEIPDEELEKASGGRMGNETVVLCTNNACGTVSNLCR